MFLSPYGPQSMRAGPVLGMVALTLWFLMVSDDVTTTLDLGALRDRNPRPDSDFEQFRLRRSTCEPET